MDHHVGASSKPASALPLSSTPSSSSSSQPSHSFRSPSPSSARSPLSSSAYGVSSSLDIPPQLPSQSSREPALSPYPLVRSPTEYISAQKLQFPTLGTEHLSPSSFAETSSAASRRDHKQSEASSVDTILARRSSSNDQPPTEHPLTTPSIHDAALSSDHKRLSTSPDRRRDSTHSVHFSSSVENLAPTKEDDLLKPISRDSPSTSATRRTPLQRHHSEVSKSRPLSDHGLSIQFPSSASSTLSTAPSFSSIQPRHSTSSHRSRPSSPAYDATHAEAGSHKPGTFSPTSSGIHARARLSSLLSPPERARYNSLANKPTMAVQAAPIPSSAALSQQPQHHHQQQQQQRHRLPSTAQTPERPHPSIPSKPVPNPTHPEGGIRHTRGASDRSLQSRHNSVSTGKSRDHETEKERERERAAARQAEQELWEKTRGAGSSVLSIAEQHRSTSSGWTEDDVLPSLSEVQHKRYDPVEAHSPDLLLSRGIADYTLLPKVLGRGKFSTVFMASRTGELSAVKHTALFPHHQLIATRLLREPTLLAELPPHPNLVEVKETIRTPGHFYLVEEFLGGYVTLESLLAKIGRPRGDNRVLPLHVADLVLSQLLSAVRAIHTPLQICHRDIKPENILVHEETLQLKLLDFGLATHFSKSDPKLTTCCGSPAFHCPEIVKALASPPGSVSYWGPDVDAWTCGVTMLRVLTGVRYPLGSSHSSLRSMAIRAQRAVTQIPLSDEQGGDEALGRRLKDKIGKLLEMDSVKRMRNLEDMAIERDNIVQPERGQKSFKSTTFVPTEPNHKMNLPLLTEEATKASSLSLTSPTVQNGFPWGQDNATPGASRQTTPANSRPASPAGLHDNGSAKPSLPRLLMLNSSMEPSQRVLSYIKYCLRCAGILYHTWPDKTPSCALSPTTPVVPSGLAAGVTSPGINGEGFFFPTTPLPRASERMDVWSHVQLFQCVIEYKEERAKKEQEESSGLGFVQSIMAAFGRRPSVRRSNSQPSASPSRAISTPNGAGAMTGTATPRDGGNEGAPRWLTFYMFVKFPKASKRNVSHPGYSRQNTLANIRRARASSAAAEASPGTQSLASAVMPPLAKAQSHTDFAKPVANGRGDLAKSGAPASSGSSTKSQPSSAAQQASASSTPRASMELEIETRPDALRTLSAQQGGGVRAMTPTRSRKNSRVSKPLQNKVIIEVTDERALAALRAALSVGGTTDQVDVDDTRRHSLQSATTTTTAGGDSNRSGAGGGGTDSLSESKEPEAPACSDQVRRSTEGGGYPRGRRSQSYQGPRAGRSSGPPKAGKSSGEWTDTGSPLPSNGKAPSSETSTQREHEGRHGRSAGPVPVVSGHSTQHRSRSRDGQGTSTVGALDTIEESQPTRGRASTRPGGSVDSALETVAQSPPSQSEADTKTTTKVGNSLAVGVAATKDQPNNNNSASRSK